jgi:hypothetical protein
MKNEAPTPSPIPETDRLNEPESQSQAGGKGSVIATGSVPDVKLGPDELHPAVIGDLMVAGLVPRGRTMKALQSEHLVVLQELKDNTGNMQSMNKSDKIRYLCGVLGHSRSAVAKALDINYQHVRNVLVQNIKRPTNVQAAIAQTEKEKEKEERETAAA